VISTKAVRDGVMAVLEYKPNKNFRSQLDLYYSKFEQTAHGRELQSNLGPESWDGAGIGARYTNPVTEVIGGDKVLVGGGVSNIDPFVLMRYGKRSDKVSALGWNNELKVGDWTATADVSLSKAKRDETVAELTASATTLGGFNFRAEPREGFSSFSPTLNYGSASVVQLRGISAWGDLNGEPSAGSLSPIKVDDEMKGLRLAAKRSLDIGPLSGVQGGLNYIDRSKDTHRTQTIYALKNGVDCIRDGDTCAPIPSAVLQSPTDLSFSGTSALVSFNVPDAMASGVYNSGPVNVSSAPGRIWGVGEKISHPVRQGGSGVQRRHSHPRQRRSAGRACQAKRHRRGLGRREAAGRADEL
jgi:iron complex outermembrane receptor protein